MMSARFPNGTETRVAFELRAVSGRKLAGYAATFDNETTIGDFREVIRAGAFRKSLLNNRDILLLADHDTARVLARTSADNLVLAEDAKGLRFEASLPDTTAARDAWTLVESRTAGGCSFGFRVVQERWTETDLRELLEVDLIECSVISAFPAYANTSVVARSKPLAVTDTMRRRLAGVY